ncbi:[protein-PII] uridylyltransferase [Luedemannella helvata]|uniref:Bifunctional uridylyltransferase/uridylyl-removing enzyme n=2 Tax=Luedemannella helvata TaxID=349315 RepID=A0ABN2KK85_9ACTN
MESDPKSMIGRTGVGAAAREQRAAALDVWLSDLFEAALSQAGVGDAADQVALVALGGLGRVEMAPYADLDLVLVHRGVREIGAIAEKIWYPIWDAGLTLDHSVRTLDEALSVAAEDTKAGLGLLDGRHLTGSADLTAQLRDLTLAQWRQKARHHLPMLRELTTHRWRVQGELAFLLDGDIKEARGGLRDVRVLRGVGYAQVADAWRPPVRAAYTRLLDARDALHLVAGRRRDRLFAQDLAEVSAMLELPGGGDALRRRVTDDARAIAYAVDDALRAAERWLAVQRRGPRRTTPAVRVPVAPDVVAQDGEVVLARAAVTPMVDPTLSLRVAAAAARNGLRISPGTLEWLARRCPPLPRPWPAPARVAFAQLLGSGPALVETWEACDRFGLVSTWLPEWARIRSAPQHNPVHRYTLDRHLIETVGHAARFARDVSRPDLLSIGALLHDIGKGLPGDHSIVGVDVATRLALSIGLPQSDADVIGTLVRWHLLLPEVATRRDLADPETVRHVVDCVRDVETLDLLHALSRADAAATGPAAWSAWKERLVADLVHRVRTALESGVVSPPPATDARFAALAAGALPAVELAPDRVVVAAHDRPGLLAAVAGCLTLHRLDVVSVDATTVPVGGDIDRAVAVVVCRVQPRDATGPDRERLVGDVRRAVSGELRVDDALAARARASRQRSASRGGTPPPPPRVVWAVDGATDATILELRAGDDVGLLFRIARALEETGADIRAARISTLGADVVDAFYLNGDWSDPDARARIERAMLAAAAPG